MFFRFVSNYREVWFGYVPQEKRIYLQIDHSDLGKQRREPLFDTYGPNFTNWSIQQSIQKCRDYNIKVPEGIALQIEKEALHANWETVKNVTWQHLLEKNLLKPEQKQNFFEVICKENKNDISELFVSLYRSGNLDSLLDSKKVDFEPNVLTNEHLKLLSEKDYTNNFSPSGSEASLSCEQQFELDM